MGAAMTHQFAFYTKLDQTILLGLKARNAAELLDGIRTVPRASIYYHTHRFLQQHHYLSPEPPNDFAYWMSEVVNNASLGEQLSSIDIIQCHKVSEIRKRLEDILASHLTKGKDPAAAPPGEEFHFMASQTFALKSPYTAHNLSEFREILQKVTINSLYYHIFDARLRIEKEENDFSLWFRTLGKDDLANEVLRLDPYTLTLEGLRSRILDMVRRHDTH
jgi:hypothetical protein